MFIGNPFECIIIKGHSKSEDRLGGSIASALWSINKGVEILRVHDVKETIQAIRVWTQIASSN